MPVSESCHSIPCFFWNSNCWSHPLCIYFNDLCIFRWSWVIRMKFRVVFKKKSNQYANKCWQIAGKFAFSNVGLAVFYNHKLGFILICFWIILFWLLKLFLVWLKNIVLLTSVQHIHLHVTTVLFLCIFQVIYVLMFISVHKKNGN